jgi:mitotic-spindle organizing protein 1
MTNVVLYEMASVLETGLDKETLSICIELIQQGVDPERLAAVVQELRRESASLKHQVHQ